MRIRDKLTFQFSIVSSLILLGFGLSIYFFSAQFRKNEFYQRLDHRVEVAEKFFLERDSFSDQDYDKIRSEFLFTLPDETEEVITLTNGWQKNFSKKYPESFLEELASEGYATFFSGKVQGVGRVFSLKNGNYAVIVTAVDQAGIGMMTNLRTIIIIALLGCVGIIAFSSYSISQLFTRPITRKIQKANTISVRNLHERLNVYNPDDELGELAIAFNNLLDRLDQAFQAQKMFVANASHEIRNPLTAILGEAEVTLEKVRSADGYQEALQNIIIEGERLNLLVNSLLQLSTVSYSQPDIKKEEVSLVDVLLHAEKKYRLLNPEHQVAIEVSKLSWKRYTVHGSFSLLETAVINLLDNASKFSANKPVQVGVEFNANQATIHITDQGIGISDEDLPKITQPFFRASNARTIKGTGIGMSLTKRIIDLHSGKMEISSRVNEGTQVHVSLPLLMHLSEN